jgi:hypothetical protein
MMTPAAQYALERIDTLTRCMGAVSQLLDPAPDLHLVKRESLACLIEYFALEFEEAQQALRLQ